MCLLVGSGSVIGSREVQYDKKVANSELMHAIANATLVHGAIISHPWVPSGWPIKSP